MIDIGPGVLVECVDGMFVHFGTAPIKTPRAGVIYTVREVVWDDCIVLEEIKNPVVNFPGGGRGESGFLMRRFKLVDKPSIEVFRDMAVKPPVDA